jgi:hypothetical protein
MKNFNGVIIEESLDNNDFLVKNLFFNFSCTQTGDN